MATTNGINYNQTRGLLLSTNGKNRVIVSTGGTTTFTGATSALGGGGGKWAQTAAAAGATATNGNTGLAGTANSGMPAAPAFLNGYYTAVINQFYMQSGMALAGQIITSTLFCPMVPGLLREKSILMRILRRV